MADVAHHARGRPFPRCRRHRPAVIHDLPRLLGTAPLLDCQNFNDLPWRHGVVHGIGSNEQLHQKDALARFINV